MRKWIAAALVLMPLPALAASVTVSGAWIRALPAQLPAAGYFIAHNTGKSAIAITGAQAAACGTLMLHQSVRGNGMDRMEHVTRVAVPAGGTAAFAPGGYHLMCVNPKAAIRPGAQIPVTLRFSDGTNLTVPFAVRNARGK
jgi:copper(I)-binding protein